MATLPMDLMPGACTLCKQNKVLSAKDAADFVTLIPDTFLGNQSTSVREFAKHKRNVKLCVACAHKVEIANEFKEQIDRKQCRKKKSTLPECLVCDGDDAKRVKTDADPEQFKKKFEVFLKAFPMTIAYKQRAVCLPCLFNLNVWFEMQELIAKMLKSWSPEESAKTVNSRRNRNKEQSPKHNHNNNNSDTTLKSKQTAKSADGVLSDLEGTAESSEGEEESRRTSNKKVFFKINLGKKPQSNKQTHICGTCKKSFSSLLSYRRHVLCHSKAKTVVINLLRYKLPRKTRASEFLKNKAPGGKGKNKVVSKKRSSQFVSKTKGKDVNKPSKGNLNKSKEKEMQVASASKQSPARKENLRKSVDKSTETAKKVVKTPDGKRTSNEITERRRSLRSPKVIDLTEEKTKEVKSIDKKRKRTTDTDEELEPKTISKKIKKVKFANNDEEIKTKQDGKGSARRPRRVVQRKDASGSKSEPSNKTEGKNKIKLSRHKEVGKSAKSKGKKRQAESEENEESDEENATESDQEQEATKAPSSSVCKICNETFIHLYEYKKHTLSHDNANARLTVNLIRCELPEKVKSSEFSSCNTNKFTREYRSKSVIDMLLRKYVGEENLKTLGLDEYAGSRENEDTQTVETTSTMEVNGDTGSEVEGAVDRSVVDEATKDCEITSEIEAEKQNDVSTEDNESVPSSESVTEMETSQENITSQNVPNTSSEEKDVSLQLNEDTGHVQTETTDAAESTVDKAVNPLVEIPETASIEQNGENQNSETNATTADEDENASTVKEALEEINSEISSADTIIIEEGNSANKVVEKSEEVKNDDGGAGTEEGDRKDEEGSGNVSADADKLLDDVPLSQGSELSDIIEGTPEETQCSIQITENRNGNASDNFSSEMQDHERDKTVDLIEDITSISNFIRESMNPSEGEKRNADDSPSPAQPKKRVRFALTTDENSSDENSDFSLLMPTD